MNEPHKSKEIDWQNWLLQEEKQHSVQLYPACKRFTEVIEYTKVNIIELCVGWTWKNRIAILSKQK